MLVVAGLSVKNLEPRVWDPASPHFLPALRAVMVSYSEFHQVPAARRRAMDMGLRAYLGVPAATQVYLDNGAFFFLRREGEVPRAGYDEFVARAKPDWWPVPQDFIPTPSMSLEDQRRCLDKTMRVNLEYVHDGYVPVIHVGRCVREYVSQVAASDDLAAKPALALGGIVPNLLRSPRAMPYREVLDGVRWVRQAFADKRLHLFGVGGTATLHLAALLAVDSTDSSGWRNRAVRGLVQLPGSGDRLVAELGSWRGRRPSPSESERLHACSCPACRRHGTEALGAREMRGFSARATHNLWTLLEEARLVEEHLAAGTYPEWYSGHLDNTIYRPLIEGLLQRASPG